MKTSGTITQRPAPHAAFAPRAIVLSALALFLLVLAPRPAHAEWYLDAYAGWSWTEDADVDIHGISVGGVPVQASLLDVRPERSVLLGVRGGYWFGSCRRSASAWTCFTSGPTSRARP